MVEHLDLGGRGLLTIVIGVVLLLTDGTIAIPGILDPEQQVALESQVMAGTGELSDWIVVAAAVLVLAGAWVVHRWRTAKGE